MVKDTEIRKREINKNTKGRKKGREEEERKKINGLYAYEANHNL